MASKVITDAETGEQFEVPDRGEVTVGYAATTGRDIRLTAAGKFVAQPRGDNYWKEFDTYSAAVDFADA